MDPKCLSYSKRLWISCCSFYNQNENEIKIFSYVFVSYFERSVYWNNKLSFSIYIISSWSIYHSIVQNVMGQIV